MQRSDARLAHAEAEARRALVAQKIAANRAVFVQQKLISMRLQAARGGGQGGGAAAEAPVLSGGAPYLSGAAMAAFDSAAGQVLHRSAAEAAGRGALQNQHPTDVESPSRVRASV